MRLQTFTAATMSEALSQVKTVLGLHAVILHTRTFQRRYCLGLRRREIVEITAGTGLQVPGRLRVDPTRRTVIPQAKAYQSLADRMTDRPAVVERSIPGRELLQTPAASQAVMRDLSDQMGSLKTMVKDLVSEVRHTRTPQIPEDVFDYYLLLINNQVNEQIATEMVNVLHKTLRPEELLQSSIVRHRLAEEIEKLVPTSGPIIRKKTVGPHVVALIGPTGVGKTTTIAKLAANLQLKEKRKVGLITNDTYRIAAIDQLRKYSDIIGSPLRVVGNADDMRTTLQSMNDCEYILIDTAGRSPNDTLKINELKGFLTAASPDEVHLVVSTTGSEACVERAIERFNDVRADKIIFTKLDEAVHVGVVLNVIRKVGKSLSYITTGQDVPDDIEEGKGRRLAQMILDNEV
jgi:flagellar biosynthesis protein FlhF